MSKPMGPGPAVLEALDQLAVALKGEPFDIFLIFREPDSDYFASVSNLEDEKLALYMLNTMVERVQSGEWRREREEVQEH